MLMYLCDWQDYVCRSDEFTTNDQVNDTFTKDSTFFFHLENIDSLSNQLSIEQSANEVSSNSAFPELKR